MSNIPPDIYERVHEFAIALANATEAGDDALSNSLSQTLRAYYEEQARLGRSHPFLTESMADYTDAPSEAARLYELAPAAEQFPPGATNAEATTVYTAPALSKVIDGPDKAAKLTEKAAKMLSSFKALRKSGGGKAEEIATKGALPSATNENKQAPEANGRGRRSCGGGRTWSRRWRRRGIG